MELGFIQTMATNIKWSTVISVVINILLDSNSSEGEHLKGYPEHSSTKSIFALFGDLCAPGTDGLLILSSLHHLEQLLLADATGFSGVVTDKW
jgi:hypothetical protein